MKHKSLLILLIASALLMMLLFPEPSLKGAQSGLLLWYQHFLPAIFPFMILSGILIRYLERGGAFFAAVTGFLNGYPNGAKTAADLQKRGLLPKETACYYAVFCNLASPMFLAAYADLQREMPLIYLVSLLLLFLFCRRKPISIPMDSFCTCKPNQTPHPFLEKKAPDALDAEEEWADTPNSSLKKKEPDAFHAEEEWTDTPNSSLKKREPAEDYLLECTRIMVKAGIYIMYFSILIEILSQPPFADQRISLLIPFLELTTGISYIESASFPFPDLRRYFRLFLCVFGGLCTAFQTREVTYGLSLTLPRYLAYKFFHASAVCLVCLLLDTLRIQFH